MILSFFGKPRRTTAVVAVYSAIVAQSRHPRFYAEWGVPDTVTGRFNMISVHLSLVLRRLRRQNRHAGNFGQELFDLFFLDMDRSLREMGVGDTTVPKRIEKMSGLFYGLLAKLTEALDADDAEALHEALLRNIYEGNTEDGVRRLTSYVQGWVAELETIDLDRIIDGKLPTGAGE